MMASVPPVKFSPNGEYFAYSSNDGTLKIWETNTSMLKHEYTPSSHLSATCTCISWGLFKGENSGSLKKRRKKKRSSGVTDLQLIALGTSSGVILLYSLAKGDLLTQLSDGHSSTVTCVCWSADGDLLYSCSTDQQIVEWDVKNGTVKRKWIGDKSTITSLCLCHTGRHLITAGRTIKLWDLDTQEVIQSFTGHSTVVFDLIPVPCSRCGGATGPDAGRGRKGSGDGQAHLVNGGVEDEIENAYFFSAAVGDRLINAWQVSSATKDKNAMASFSLPEVPVHVHFTQPTSSKQTFLLSAVTKSGQMVIFENQLNGRCKKPLKPSVTLQLATSTASRDGVPRPIPVLSSYIYDDSDRTIILVYGNLLQPKFERMPFNNTEPVMCLVREDPNKTVISLQNSISKVKTAGLSEEVTVLAPGHMTPAGPSSLATTQTTAKSKRKRTKSIDMTMEERLNAIGIDQPSTSQSSGVKQPPKADTLALLLSQGLQSRDKSIITSVLTKNNDSLIQNTVQKLPISVIVPLIQELSSRLQMQAHMGSIYIKWVRSVMTQHTSYLMSFPELVKAISTMYHMFESRNMTFNRLSRLQGKLDLMLSQVSSQQQKLESTSDDQQALLIYQEESSDEDYGMEDVIPEHLESEDNWEELDDSNFEEGGDENTDNSADEDQKETTSKQRRKSAKASSRKRSKDTSSDDDDENEDEIDLMDTGNVVAGNKDDVESDGSSDSDEDSKGDSSKKRNSAINGGEVDMNTVDESDSSTLESDDDSEST